MKARGLRCIEECGDAQKVRSEASLSSTLVYLGTHLVFVPCHRLCTMVRVRVRVQLSMVRLIMHQQRAT